MLECTAEDYVRVRTEAQPWEQATGRLLDQVELLVPVAISHGITTQSRANRRLEELAADIAEQSNYTTLWPILISCWKHKPLCGESGWSS